jgi:hypothetical protein
MLQRSRVFLFEESIDWLQFVLLTVSSVLTYAVVCYFIRLRDVRAGEVEREYPPPKPDGGALGAVAIADTLIRFVTLKLTTFFFSAMYGGAIPLGQAPFIGAFSFLLFLLCSFVVVMFISKALLPTSFGRAALISGIKVLVQLLLGGLFLLLLIVYALSQGMR